jgi:hypothetical protein
MRSRLQREKLPESRRSIYRGYLKVRSAMQTGLFLFSHGKLCYLCVAVKAGQQIVDPKEGEKHTDESNN